MYPIQYSFFNALSVSNISYTRNSVTAQSITFQKYKKMSKYSIFTYNNYITDFFYNYKILPIFTYKVSKSVQYIYNNFSVIKLKLHSVIILSTIRKYSNNVTYSQDVSVNKLNATL